MRKFKPSVILVFVLAAGFNGYSQNTVNTTGAGGLVEIRLLNGEKPKDFAEGSAYLEEDFALALVDDYKKQYLVRFNAEQGLMEFKNENNKTLVLSNEQAYVIRFQDGSGRVYRTMDFLGKRAMLREAWSDEKGHAFLVRETVRFYPKEKAASSYGSDKPDRYERQEDLYYFKDATGLIIDLPQKKRKLIKLFGDKGARQFFKKEKVNVKTEEGLLQFVKSCLVSANK